MRTIQLHESGGEVLVGAKGVITLRMRGKQTASSVRELEQVLDETIVEIQTETKKVRVIADLREMKPSDITSGARIESRRLLKNKVIEAGAIVGNSPLLAVTTYLTRAVRPGMRVRYFSSIQKAEEWLAKPDRTTVSVSKTSLFSGILIAAIGATSFVGWLTDSAYLTSWLPHLRPINPVAALILTAGSFGLIAYWLQKSRLVQLASALSIIAGVVMLLPIPIDMLFFAEKLRAADLPVNIGDSAAICFIVIGIGGLFQNLKKLWQAIIQYICAGIGAAVALFNIFGLLYAPGFMYDISPTFAMALPLAVAFFAASLTLIILVMMKRSVNILRSISGIGWLAIIALLFVQIATYVAWEQANVRVREQSQVVFDARTADITNAVNARLKTYIDTLHGFRGLFAASNEVTQSDFTAYFSALELEKNYPGLRSLTFIAAVKNEDLAAFEQAQRSMYPDFQIQSLTNEPLHLIVLQFAGAASNANLGLDISSIPGRSEIYGAALAQGEPVASGTITFPTVGNTAPEDGFFITIPVRSALSTEFVGVVNANFNYADFFPALFDRDGLLNDLDVKIIDPMQNKVVYEETHTPPEAEKLTKTVTIPVATGSWQMQVASEVHFGISRSESQVPIIVLVAGQLFSALLFLIFMLQSRGRQRALELVDMVTEDLRIERNNAVASSRKSNAILAGIGDGVFALDMKGRVTLFNLSAEQITGYSADEVMGKHYSKVLSFQNEKTRRPYNAFIKKALAGQLASMPRGIVMIHKNGKIVPVADSAAPFYDDRKRQQGVIVVFRDATDERAFERTKDEFVSLASHQLRTPLSAINWYVEMLLNGDAGKLTAEQEDYLREIALGNSRMVELINSLLSVSRLDLGKLENHPEDVSVPEVISSLTTELQGEMKKKELTFTQNVEQAIQTMFLDPKLFRMILQNLLSNATKYTPNKGTVTLGAQISTKSGDKDAHGDYVLFSIKDTGYGIPKQQQPKIFGKMYRAENVQKLGIEGTGLGLYIVKSAAEKMGGRVWFESMESVGTTFYVLLPIRSHGQVSDHATITKGEK